MRIVETIFVAFIIIFLILGFRRLFFPKKSYYGNFTDSVQTKAKQWTQKITQKGHELMQKPLEKTSQLLTNDGFDHSSMVNNWANKIKHQSQKLIDYLWQLPQMTSNKSKKFNDYIVNVIENIEYKTQNFVNYILDIPWQIVSKSSDMYHSAQQTQQTVTDRIQQYISNIPETVSKQSKPLTSYIQSLPEEIEIESKYLTGSTFLLPRQLIQLFRRFVDYLFDLPQYIYGWAQQLINYITGISYAPHYQYKYSQNYHPISATNVPNQYVSVHNVNPTTMGPINDLFRQ